MPGCPELLGQTGRATCENLWMPSTSHPCRRSSACECENHCHSRTDDRVFGGTPCSILSRDLRQSSINNGALLAVFDVQRDERRFENIRELNQVGHKECVDRCIRSSFCHLDEPLRLAFMALGFFRGSFEVEAAEAVLSSLSSGDKGNSRSLAASSATPGSSSFFPGYAYANSRNRAQDDDVSSVRSLGSQLSSMDEFSFENDGAMTNDSYDLLDLESTEEIKARSVEGERNYLHSCSHYSMSLICTNSRLHADAFFLPVPSAKVALASLHQWSLVEYDSRASRYRMHNLVQLFAEDEAIRMGDEALEEESKQAVPTSFVSVTPTIESPSSCPLGRELHLTWKRRFVRYYCMVVAKASHAYRFDGRLDLFDKERPNIESAMRLAHELTVQSIEQVRETKRQTREKLVDDDDELLGGCDASSDASSSQKETRLCSSSGKTVKDSSIVDALLYSNLVVRSRFIFRARVDPRRRIQVMSSCLQLSRETRSLNCTCGNSENDPSTLLWDVEEAKHDRELWILDKLPSFEDSQPPEPITNGCSCIGIRELVALEALLLTDLGYASCDVADWIAGEYYYLESLRLQREVLGWSEHPQLAEVLNQLGICLSNHRGYQTFNVWLLQHAEKLLKGSLMMRARVLGENHPEFATSLNNLANFYKNCGTNNRKYSKKHSDNISSTRSVDGSEDGHDGSADSWPRGRSFGSDRGSSASSDSAALSEGKADLEDDEPDIEGMYRRSLKIREATLGRDHPQVAQSLNNVALFLSNQLDARKIKYAAALVTFAVYIWFYCMPH